MHNKPSTQTTTIEAKDNQPIGLLAGYCMESGKEVRLPFDALPQHIAICGATGSGTSILSQSLLKQQISNGGGLLLIDSRSIDKDLKSIYQNACLAGRKNDFLLLNPTDPKNSNTYNPIMFGDAEEVSFRIMRLVSDTAVGVETDFFRLSAKQALEVFISAFQVIGKPYHLTDLESVLLDKEALLELKNILINNHQEAKETSAFLSLLSRYTTDNGFDMEKFKETLGGLAGRLHDISAGPLGDVLNTYNPEINFEQCILQNKIVYVKLPIFNSSKQAVALAKLIVDDFRSAIARCQKLSVEELPNPPFMFDPNECSAYIDESWSRLFEQARTSRIFVTPTFQTIKSLQPMGNEKISEIVLGNTKFKFFFKHLSLESATQSAEVVGTYIKTNVAKGSVGKNVEKEYIVEPKQFFDIPVGECLLLVDGSELYKLRLPKPCALENGDYELELNHLPETEVTGLNLSRFGEPIFMKSKELSEQ